jgi:hypothetical protein
MKAMTKEIMSHYQHNTHQVVEAPIDANIVDSKWIFTVKEREGKIIYKSRLVARGFSQEQGVDYDETYSPVACHPTIQIFFARSAYNHWRIHQMDVDTAYLNAVLDHNIYMKPPEGFRAGGVILCPPEYICKPNHSLKLLKALYGTKQAGRQWFKRLREFIISIGYKQAKSDQCLFYVDSYEGHNEILVYVDDILIAGDSLDETIWVKNAFKKEFSMKDLGLCKKFLNILVDQNFPNGTITLSASPVIARVISEFQFDDDLNYPIVDIPLDPIRKLSADMCPQSDEEKEVMQRIPFQKLMGILQYLGDKVRYDILQALGTISAFMHNPGINHWVALVRVVQYLKGTRNLGLILGRKGEEIHLTAWADANLADGKTTLRSRTGGVLMYGKSLIRCISHRQSSTASSTVQAEVNALHEVMKEVEFFRGLLTEMGIPNISATTIYEDNQSTIALTQTPGGSKRRTRYLELKLGEIREFVEVGTIYIQQVSSEDNIADFFTKSLAGQKFIQFRDFLGFIQL